MKSSRPYLLLILLFALISSVTSVDAAFVQLLKPLELSQLGESMKVIDARPFSAWQKEHIPGAVSLDWRDYTKTDTRNIAYCRLPSEDIAERLGRLGIDEQSELVIYGDADSSWGGEGWVCWLLSELGHRGTIYLLEGGVQAWQKVGPLTAEITPVMATHYHFSERVDLDIKTAALLKRKTELQLVDTRSFFEWLGGSIPGAVRINWTNFFDGEERHPIDRTRLIALLRKNGVNPEKPVVYFCSGGIRSAYAWTVHDLAGLQQAKNYEGGIEAWRKLR